MKKTIVALTDFSDDAVNAAYYAADLAIAAEADLILLNVCFIPAAVSEVPVMPDTIDNWLFDCKEQMRLQERQLNSYIKDRIKLSTVLLDGPVMSQVKDYCETVNPWTVVMGAETIPVFERLFIEPQTVVAIASLSWPVLVVPPGVRFSSIRKIGLACDLKHPVNPLVYNYIKFLTETFGASLHILHGADNNTFDPSAVEQAGWIQDMFFHLSPEIHFIANDREDPISRFAEENEIDLLIVMPQPHSFLEKVFHKSFSKDIVLKTRKPVLSVHQ